MAEQDGQEDDRGRDSASPVAIPRRGWRDILLRTKDRILASEVDLIAAGLAFYGLLAIFPGVGALIFFYGLAANPAQVFEHFLALESVVPGESWDILRLQMTRLASEGGDTLGLAAAGSLLIALWSASRGTRAFITAMNVAYNEVERRGFVRLNLLAIVLTLFLIVLGLLAIAVTIAVPALLAVAGLGDRLDWMLSVLRWPAIALVFVIALAVLYRFAPCRRDAKWRWLTPGSVVAILLWLVVSVAFSAYLRNFGSYDKTYGSIGAVVATLLWFWISAYVIILGAALNAEIEHQTGRDSTRGRPKPFGQRGAYVADTLGEPR